MVHFIENLAPILLLIEKGVLALLVFLEVAIIAIFLWRFQSYAKQQGNASKWILQLTQVLKKDGLSGISVTEADLLTLPGRVVKTGLENQGLPPEAMEKVFEVQESIEKRSLDQGLSFLGTVGANAPFLGLTGTVIGILVAFDRFAASGGRGSTEVMVAISQALVATAIGLIVAIPAVVFYNILRSRSKRILEEAREIRGLILAQSLRVAFSRPEV